MNRFGNAILISKVIANFILGVQPFILHGKTSFVSFCYVDSLILLDPPVFCKLLAGFQRFPPAKQ
ncbi:hypothetical protein [Leptospira ainazelensis]|uniref:hypothetical protein n=1 Tax=Leptospira ainazelensis TaxID=2810034 RepID=UPI0019655577|nr:hypothetical protein [Leptospira ainazelensis]